MKERTGYVVDTAGMADASRVDVCRAVLRAIESDAALFETDLPWAMAAEWPAEVCQAAEKLQMLSKRRRSDGDAYGQTGVQRQRHPEIWDAFVTFAPYAFDASVSSPEAGTPVVSLADCSDSIVARLTVEQAAQLVETIGRNALVPLEEWRHRR